MVFNEMDENIKESLIHYVYLVLFIGMLTAIIQYKGNSKKSDVLYILIGLLLFILSLYFLRVLNAFDLYNSIVHGLGITIAILLLLSFINHNNNNNLQVEENESEIGSEETENILLRIGKIFTDFFNYLKKKLGGISSDDLKKNIQKNPIGILLVVNVILFVIFAIVYKIKN